MLGLPNASDLNGIVTNLGTIVASLGPEESAVVKTAMDQLSAHADALEDKVLADAKELEDPLLTRLDALTAILQPFAAFANGFEVIPRAGKM